MVRTGTFLYGTRIINGLHKSDGISVTARGNIYQIKSKGQEHMINSDNINPEYADIDELLHQGGSLVDTGDANRLAYLNKGLFVCDAVDPEAVHDYDLTPWYPDMHMMCIHDEATADFLMEDGGFTEKKLCSQWIYTGGNFDLEELLDACDTEENVTFNRLTSFHVDRVAELTGESIRYVENRIRAGALFGMYVGRTLAGFIGMHEAGSMGMMHILPRFRGHKLGKLLEAFAINLQLDNGCIPFGHVVEGNEISEKLQLSLGLTRCEHPAVWIFK